MNGIVAEGTIHTLYSPGLVLGLDDVAANSKITKRRFSVNTLPIVRDFLLSALVDSTRDGNRVEKIGFRIGRSAMTSMILPIGLSPDTGSGCLAL